MEAKIRYLEMIQGAIDRASDNSLRIKGFAMLLLAGTIAFAVREGSDPSAGLIPLPIALVLLIAAVSIGILDFYFVRQSDLFGILYNDAMRHSEGNVDFSMDTRPHDEVLSRRYEAATPIPLMATIFLHVSVALVVILATLPPVWLKL